jgi:putative ABC transport system permease protein
MLEDKFATMYAYINVASAVAMTVCFLLILVTMYTMVVERTGQIAVLKAMGAGRGLLLVQSIVEAAILSVSGTVLGLGLSVVAKRIIETFMPLLTVDLSPRWIVLSVLVGMVGGTVSALYPGWRAGKIEPALALQSN